MPLAHDLFNFALKWNGDLVVNAKTKECNENLYQDIVLRKI